MFQNPDPPEAPAPEIPYLESQNGIDFFQKNGSVIFKNNSMCPQNNSIANKQSLFKS